MADQSDAASQGAGRPGVVDPYERSCFKFQDVLQHELAIVAARRAQLAPSAAISTAPDLRPARIPR